MRPKTLYNELKPYYTLKNKNDNTLIFESRFESGNLLAAFRTKDENSYQLYLQNDTNTTWYILKNKNIIENNYKIRILNIYLLFLKYCLDNIKKISKKIIERFLY